jgi:hypothetical protein
MYLLYKQALITNPKMKIKKFFVLSLPVFLFALILPNITKAAQCSFTRDLAEGSSGSDVKCLQQYLNNTSFKISSSGVGSPGHETITLRNLTKQAIKKWQSANGISSTGYFGPVSRQKYLSLTAISTVPVNTTNNTASIILSKTEMQAKINAMLEQINKLKDQRIKTTTEKQDTKTEAKESLTEAETAINDTQSKVDTAYKDGKQVDRSNEYLKDAKEKLIDANRAYKKDNYSNSLTLTNEIFDLVDKALTKIGITSTSKTEAKEELDKAENTIKNAEIKINEADRLGKEVDNSNTIINDANNKFNQAKSYYDNKDYVQTINYANAADNLADDAVDAIGESETTEAETAINNAKNSLNDAKSLITSGSYSSAINRLISAKSSINEARGSLATKYDTAIEYLTEARDYITEADKYLDDSAYSNASISITKALEKLDHALGKF